MKEEMLAVRETARRAHMLRATVICLFAGIVLALSGCAQESPSDQARSFVEETLSGLSSGDYRTADELLSASGFDSGDYGISAEVFDKYYFASFAYSVNSVSVRSDTQATVNITVSAHPMDAVVHAMESASKAAVRARAKTAKSGYADKAFAKRADKLAAQWKAERLTADVELTRGDDGMWSFAEPGTLGAVLLDGCDMRQIAE